MATANWGLDRSWTAAIDFSTCGQWRFMKAGSIAGEVALNTTAGGSVLGVLQNNPKAGEEAVVRHFGFTKVHVNTSSSGFTWGKAVQSGSDGMAYGATLTTGAASIFAMGIALETVTTSTSQVSAEMYLMPWPGVDA